MTGEPEVAPDAVRDQLHRILASAYFQASKQLSQFLRFVVEETLAARGDQIKAYTIAVTVLGRSSSYDPQTDATVRILAGRLRTRLDQYYSGAGTNDPVRITIPKGRYLPVFHATESVGHDADSRARPLPAEPPGGRRNASIAILPLSNLDGKEDQDYFANGLTEQLIRTLGDYHNLRVLPRYATLGFTDQHRNVYRIGHDLGIRFILEGSVQKSRETLRVSVYLSDVEKRRQVWAECYQRTLTAENLFAVQDEIAQNVITRIADIYGGVIPRAISKERRKIGLESLTAYDASLRYMYFFSVLTLRVYHDTRYALERAVETEPDNPELAAMLADVLRIGYALGLSGEGNPLVRVMDLTRQAVALNPLSQQARTSLAGGHQLNRDREGMIRETEKLISLKPYGVLFGTAGWYLALAGEWKRGLAIVRGQMEIMQYYPGWFHIPFFLHHYRRGEYQAALHEAQRMNMPNVFIDALQRAAASGQLGRRAEAAHPLAEMLAIRPDFPATPHRYLNWLIPFDDLVAHLLEGLAKAGLVFP